MSQNHLSRFLLVLGLLLSIGLFLFTPLQANSLDDDEDDVEIVVVPEGESPDPPRSPSATRIDV